MHLLSARTRTTEEDVITELLGRQNASPSLSGGRGVRRHAALSCTAAIPAPRPYFTAPRVSPRPCSPPPAAEDDRTVLSGCAQSAAAAVPATRRTRALMRRPLPFSYRPDSDQLPAIPTHHDGNGIKQAEFVLLCLTDESATRTIAACNANSGTRARWRRNGVGCCSLQLQRVVARLSLRLSAQARSSAMRWAVERCVHSASRWPFARPVVGPPAGSVRADASE
jgi:hypothetical protein